MDTRSGLDKIDPPAASADRATPAPGRIPIAGLVVVVAIAASIAIALILVLAVPQDTTTYDPGSPEAAFQTFYLAFEAGDLEGAYALFSRDVKARLTLAEYRQLESEQSWQRDQDQRVVLLETDVTGDRASLGLRIDAFYEGGGLGASRSSQERTVRLARQDGAWLIDEPIMGVESLTYGF